MIHLSFAVEFKQPLLLAEALAQAAVHEDPWYRDYLVAAEAESLKHAESALPLSTCFDMEKADPKISTSSGYEYMAQRRPSGRWAGDIEQARDGILAKSFDEIVRIAARYRVDPNDLDRATAELINTAGESATLSHFLKEGKFSILEYR